MENWMEEMIYVWTRLMLFLETFILLRLWKGDWGFVAILNKALAFLGSGFESQQKGSNHGFDAFFLSFLP